MGREKLSIKNLEHAGGKFTTTLHEWYSEYEDCIDFASWEDLSPNEILYIGYADCYDSLLFPAIILHKLTFNEFEITTVENLGVHLFPEEAMEAAKIGHYHKAAAEVLDYFQAD